ncbi:unnamed protein product [Rotaria socialis]|uniref:Alpha/beta hydrolase fold-3 domain-containing protein n=1 Tax=Rotaria socialis TaxID=392032 RepID=A0A817ZZE7_9BILA|nr:unnamed protein product [Rotaria socialis]CAF4376678.1 unnamed protein product [Rotaria socialis]
MGNTNIYKQSPYDRELATVLQQMSPGGKPFPLTLETIPMMRRNFATMSLSDDQLQRGGQIDIKLRKVPGPQGAPEISLLICRPSASQTTKSGSLLPCIYYMHGGGMISGDNRFIEYRLAPEHPHPAPSEDCYAGLLWTAEHAQDLGIDLTQISVAGVSAGGGLAAATALMARDRHGPKLQGQLLVCPMLDDRDQTLSTLQYADIGTWNRQSNQVGWTALLGKKKGTQGVSPYAAPSRAQDLSNLPPAFIDVSSTEIFRDEDIDYAQRIWQTGGVAELHVWPGGFHAFTVIEPNSKLSQHAIAASANWYRRLLAFTSK